MYPGPKNTPKMFTFTINNVYTSVLFSQGWEHNIILNALTFEQPSPTFFADPGSSWDGKCCFLKHSEKGYFFPTGLLASLIEKLPAGCDTKFIDARKKPARPMTSHVTACQDQHMQAIIAKERGIVRISPSSLRTEIAADIIHALGTPRTLFVTRKKESLRRIASHFSQRHAVQPGIIGDGKYQPAHVTTASFATLNKRKDSTQTIDFLKSIELLLLDDCHRRTSNAWYRLGLQCPAYYRFAFSETLRNINNISDLRLIALTGKVIAEIH